MSACPNPNDQAWKDLVIAFNSEADAMTAFVRNNNQVPTVEEALQIMKDLRIQDKDEQLSLASDQFKLSRAVQQRTMLETMKFRSNKNQKVTIQKLIDMNQSYQDFLNDNIKGIITNFDSRQNSSSILKLFTTLGGYKNDFGYLQIKNPKHND